MSTEFLGVGWNFPVRVDKGSVRMAAYEESIRQSIWIILSTSRGERAMRPEFGCGLNDLVFALNNAATVGQAAYEVRHALELWERRIELLGIVVNSAGRGEILEIHIEYRILSTNSRYNLVYPFYLKRSEA
jgi:phage baseplate assembly protein W